MNRLAGEKSPYLQQHATNPVDWYPWGSDAFEKARADNKPIFLSIGYSTCHWCHVMAHESFENNDIAELLNAGFVSVKVDREERPDIDQIYMTAVQAMQHAGGWPLTVFLTPDGKPFAGGTYFPPEDRWGRAGMKTLLPRIMEIWKTQRSEVENSGSELARMLTLRTDTTTAPEINSELFKRAYQEYEKRFDAEHGGFGSAPKFPASHNLSFLMQIGQSSGYESAVPMVEKTLTAMACGGLQDQLGGGFHRYSTDQEWLVPHFEKMLYDQALLARTYTEAYALTKNRFYKTIAMRTLHYVLRDLTHPDGPFFSAEDADSEGKEGVFYVWTAREIRSVLGHEKGSLMCRYYGVTENGNFEGGGMNVLSISKSDDVFAAEAGLSPEAWRTLLEESKQKLLLVRNQRTRPHRDEKILTGWNGLMISALAFAGRVFDDASFIESAQKAAAFILKNLQRDGRLLRRYCGGESAIPAFQDDYSAFSLALLDLYEATLDVHWLFESERLMLEMIRLFEDPVGGGFFLAGADAERLIARDKEIYDGAVPSGNSMAAMLLVRFGKMFQRDDWLKRIVPIARAVSTLLGNYPTAVPQLLCALHCNLTPTAEIILTGNPSDPAFIQLRREIDAGYLPNRWILHVPRDGRSKELLGRKVGFLQQMNFSADAAAYICKGCECGLPASSPDELKRLLRSFRETASV